MIHPASAGTSGRTGRRRPRSPHEEITLRFETGDVVTGLDYGDGYFDHRLALGLLEVLDGDLLEPVLDEVARLTARGVYVRDLLDSVSGFHPRPDVDELLAEQGFDSEERHRVLEESFVEEGTLDPLDVWPMNLHQVLSATASDPATPEARY